MRVLLPLPSSPEAMPLWPSLTLLTSPLQTSCLIQKAGLLLDLNKARLPSTQAAESWEPGWDVPGCQRSQDPKDPPHLLRHTSSSTTFPQEPWRNSVPERTLIFWATTVSFPSDPERRDGKDSKFTPATFSKGIMCVTSRCSF